MRSASGNGFDSSDSFAVSGAAERTARLHDIPPSITPSHGDDSHLLSRIASPADVKALAPNELAELCREIRTTLLAYGHQHGGHIGSNLGMVEATVALHRVFDSPRDRIVFDVSHQSYVHKMLTGRAAAYLDPDRFSEVTGFTNPDESKHDQFVLGHTGTSISLACGLAKTRDMEGPNSGIGNVIAVVDAGLEEELSKEADYLLASEVADAGCIVMSKSQDASPEEIQGTIEHVNQALEKVHCSRRFCCEMDDVDTVNIIHKNWDEMSKEDFDRIASCGYVMASYRKPEFEAEDAFTSLYFMNVKMTEKELREAAEKILSDPECGRVFRMKGFMRVDSDSEDGSGLSAWAECDRRQWIELNATKNEITIRPLHVGQEVLIVIGEELHEEKIKSYLKI